MAGRSRSPRERQQLAAWDPYLPPEESLLEREASWDPYFPGGPAEAVFRPPPERVRRPSVHTPWATRSPRKRRSDAGKHRATAPQPQLGRSSTARAPRAIAARAPRGRSSAAAPASAPQASGPLRDPRQTVERLGDAAARVAAGRTVSVLQKLMQCSLLCPEAASVAPPPSQQLAAGVSARLRGEDVFVLAVYTKWRVPRADVVPLRREGDGWVARLRDAQTVEASSLTEVDTRFTPRPDETGKGASVHFQRSAPLGARGATPSPGFAPARGLANQWAARVAVPRDPAETRHLCGRVAEIQPQALRDHEAATAALGDPHGAQPRADRVRQVRYVLDVPLPVPFDARPWRCIQRDCRQTFPVKDTDVCRAFPGILIHQTPREAPIYMTAAFLAFVIQNFYEEMNTRAVRRRVVSLYAANALSLQLGSGALAAVTAVPPPAALRSMLKVALGNFLDEAVARAQRLQCLYNGQVIRGDGNFKLAKRVCRPVWGTRFRLRPFTVVLGWTGTDGSLLKPVTLKRGETLNAVVEDLAPLLDDIKAARLAADLPPEALVSAARAIERSARAIVTPRSVYDRCAIGFAIGASVSAIGNSSRAPRSDHAIGARSWVCAWRFLAIGPRSVRDTGSRDRCPDPNPRSDAETWPEACAPVFHATDNFRSQRGRLQALYRQKWPEFHTRVLARTPLGDATGSTDVDACPTRITGDPRHDIIALRKLVPPSCNDWHDFIADHTDALNRLSAPPPPASTPGDLPPALTQEARRLLRFGVEQPAAAFRQEILQRPRAAGELRKFFGFARVLQAPVWKDEFKALPPRGTLERLARRLGARLHPEKGFHNFDTQSSFKTEVRRIKKWYTLGRKLTRARRGMIRSETAPARVQGVRSVMNAKVKAHYRRLLLDTRLEGLFAWRDAAVAIREAGVAVQSGTVSIERVWSSLLDMFPDQARNISPEWFALCSKVAFLRFNYRHFHAGQCPGWCHDDPLLAERVDHLAAQLRLMADQGLERADGAMAGLWEPFS